MNSQRVAIITGGTRGIGRQVAGRLAETGHAVVLNHVHDIDAANQAISELKLTGATAMAVKGDIGDEGAVAQLFKTAEQAFGGVDVVVNAAGIIGVTGPVAQQAARSLRPGGSLITFSSSATRLSRPGSAAYTMSKGAVEALTLLLARELRSRDGEHRGAGRDRNGSLRTLLEGRPEVREELIAASPMERLGMPDDIAGVVAFLASPQGRWINGQTIYVNGGAA